MDSVPVRVWVARVLLYRGRAETYSTLSTLFQGVCGQLRETGALPGVYPELAAVKQRLFKTSQPLDLDDVMLIVEAHNARAGSADALVLGDPRMVLSVPGTGERMAYHRELTQNLNAGQPQLTLNGEAQTEVLANLLDPRNYGSKDRDTLLELRFPQEGLNVLRVLDTLYKVTFSRTVRKELCDPKILVPLPGGTFRLKVDQSKTLHLTLPVFDLLRPLLFRLYRTPDLAAVLDADDRARGRIQDGMRILTGALHDATLLPRKQEEVAAILRHRDDGETLEEL